MNRYLTNALVAVADTRSKRMQRGCRSVTKKMVSMTMQKIPRFRTQLIKSSSSSLWSRMMTMRCTEQRYILLKYQCQTHVLPCQPQSSHKRAHDDRPDTACVENASWLTQTFCNSTVQYHIGNVQTAQQWHIVQYPAWPEAVFQVVMLQTEQHVFSNVVK